MARSFIDKGGKGFWVQDELMQIALHYVLANSKGSFKSEGWPEDFVRKIEFNAWGFYPGFMNLDLDLYLDSDDKNSVFINHIEKTIRYLENHYANQIPPSDLNAFHVADGVKSNWVLPLHKNSVIQVLKVLILVLQRKWHKKADDQIDYDFYSTNKNE